MAENTAPGTDIGAPVAATDADNDVLTYTLEGAERCFLLRHRPGHRPADDQGGAGRRGHGQRTPSRSGPRTRPVFPRRSMPTQTNSDTVMVEIAVTDVNEPPAVNGECDGDLQRGHRRHCHSAGRLHRERPGD